MSGLQPKIHELRFSFFQSSPHRSPGLHPHLLQDPGGFEEGRHGQQEQEGRRAPLSEHFFNL